MKFLFSNSNSLLLYFVCIIKLFEFTLEDLPIHCLKSQIVGKWKVYTTELYSVNSGHEMKCGHLEPSTEDTSWRAKTNLPFPKEFEIELKPNDKVSSHNEVGDWTMIYDEGFNMEFKDLSYFAFSKYAIERNKTESDIISYQSKCYSTCLGWFHNKNRTKWGCYRAEKMGVDFNQTVYQRQRNLTVEEITYVDPASRKNKIADKMMRFLSPPAFFKIDIENHLLQHQNFHRQHYEKLKLVKKSWTEELYPQFMNMSLRELNEFAGISRARDTDKEFVSQLGSEFRFASKDEREDHDHINNGNEEEYDNDEKAEEYDIEEKEDIEDDDDKEDKEDEQENDRAEILKEKNAKNLGNVTTKTNTNVNVINNDKRTVNVKPQLNIEEKFQRFPKNFDWRDKLRPTESQGGCGSCYAWAAMKMLETRIKILYGDDVHLSVQHALDCSYYNQGCKGGFTYLVLKFSKEFELVPEECHPYEMKTGKCSNSCDVNKLDFPYTVDSYSYLGGAYGVTNETMMMEELYKQGPYVVSIEPDINFVYYKSGIYSGIKNSTWASLGLPVPEWRKVDHSVLLVGWGEDEVTKEKYWLIQNSWGANWGDNGFFKIRRGTDELHVESMPEVAIPGLKKGASVIKHNNSMKK